MFTIVRSRHVKRPRSVLSRCFLRQESTLPREYDVVVVGGGPGGYVAAIKAAQLGLKTGCVEKQPTLGGTCLNVGCIPSKSLLNNTQLYQMAKYDFAKRGIIIGESQNPDEGLRVDLEKMMKNKDQTVNMLTRGIAGLFRKNKVDFIKGHANLVSKNELKIKQESEGEELIKAKHIIIATGSEPIRFPGVEFDEEKIISSTGALSLSRVPENMIVIGGGIIGLELGSVWNRLGSHVTVVEYQDFIGGVGMDEEVSRSFKRILEAPHVLKGSLASEQQGAHSGIEFKLSTKVLSIGKIQEGGSNDRKVAVEVQSVKDLSQKQKLVADVVLVAIGRKPYTDGLGVDRIGIKLDEKGRIITDRQFRTSIDNIRCIGDVTTGQMLAHKAEEEGIAVAEFLAGGVGSVSYHAIPSVIYTHPEVAWCGVTEQELSKKQTKYKKGVFPFLANSRAKTNGDTEGWVKVLTDAANDHILGVHIIGPNAGEMIAEAVIAIEYGAAAEDIARTCHAHPTLSEAFKEACMASSFEKAIHI